MSARFLLPLLLMLCSCTEEEPRPVDPRSPEMFRSFAASLDHGGVNRAFNERVASLIRAGRHEEAEQELLLRIDGAPPSALKSATLATSLSDLSFDGWDRVLERIRPIPPDATVPRPRGRRLSGVEPYRRLEQGYPPITAIGIDISGHTIENVRDASDPMAFEVSYYSDGPFPFSRTDRAGLLAHSERYGTDWQGAFEDVDTALEVTGLGPLLLALREHRAPWPAVNARDEWGMKALAQWWVILLVDRALSDELADLSPRRPVPLILGTHNFRPYINAVHDLRITT